MWNPGLRKERLCNHRVIVLRAFERNEEEGVVTIKEWLHCSTSASGNMYIYFMQCGIQLYEWNCQGITMLQYMTHSLSTLESVGLKLAITIYFLYTILQVLVWVPTSTWHDS